MSKNHKENHKWRKLGKALGNLAGLTIKENSAFFNSIVEKLKNNHPVVDVNKFADSFIKAVKSDED